MYHIIVCVYFLTFCVWLLYCCFLVSDTLQVMMCNNDSMSVFNIHIVIKYFGITLTSHGSTERTLTTEIISVHCCTVRKFPKCSKCLFFF